MHAHHRLDWEPNVRQWRVSMCFIVGSLCFAVGSLPTYVADVDARVAGATFFVGSLWFTAGATGQWYETVLHDRRAGDPSSPRWIIVDDLDWWASVVQVVGTVMFNVSTALAMVRSFDVEEEDRFVWGPDVLGSIAFLVASAMAWWAVCGRWFRWHPHDVEWRVAAINLAGSVLFGVSAVAAVVLSTGEELDATLVNATTFAGAVCFLWGAYLLLPSSDSRSR